MSQAVAAGVGMAACRLCTRPTKITAAQAQGVPVYHHECAVAAGLDHGPALFGRAR